MELQVNQEALKTENEGENKLKYLSEQWFLLSVLTGYRHSLLNHQSASLDLLSVSNLLMKESV